MLWCDCHPYPLSPVGAVCPELVQAKLITVKECKPLNDLSELVGLQYSKSSEMMSETADILKSYGFEGECKLLKGKLM